ncbi:phage tail protein [Xenorhabdus bharatensis]|uniref:phage tail protein n=1 Tax=Xenorhabdus bharatensis TaxID=3136256 RepID=UPI0030F3F7BE
MSKYFALLTRLGADRLANAAALGTKIEITHMAVGDGGGSLPTPDTNQQKLINEKRRAAINVLSVDPKNTNQIIAEQVIPEHEGGWWIREIGLFDKDGVLMAVGNCAETYKPQLQEGSGRTQTIRMVLIVSHTNAVTLKIDPSVVLATREYADASIVQAIREHAQSRRHPDATLTEKGFVILSNAVDSQSETQAATPRAVKVVYDLASSANNNANGRVPANRQINGRPLSADITLSAADVNAYTKTETDSRVNDTYSLAKVANQNAANANRNANNRLEKAKNGADIQDKQAFVENLGLANVKWLAENAYPIKGGAIYGNIDAAGYISGEGIFESGSIRVYSPNNKPKPDEIGAYPQTGGVLHGNVDATGFLRSGEGQNIVSSQDVWAHRYVLEKGQRVYSPNNPPTEALLEENGWFRDNTHGMVIQWGRGKYSDGQRVDFPRPFTRFVCAVTISSDPAETANAEIAQAYPQDKTAFVVACGVYRNDGFHRSELNCTWIAIGY